ncbi:MAG: 2-C-methyl-D-erythritol 4-phosphate cytidylyltransferase [Fermentimonas sp.]|nr:2-C-methyl-D-erythritol 4-phosphate cytidylyltransferase [Fermentimonas sp.]
MINQKKYSAVIVAGGKGYRAGGELPKQFLLISGKPMLMHTINAFYLSNKETRIIVVLPKEFISLWQQLCSDHNFVINHRIVVGGETRFHSVKNGLNEVPPDDFVAIHDGARPFVSPELIQKCFNESYKNQCGVIPVIDEINSVRRLTDNGSEIIDRSQLKLVQTPQVFPAHLLKNAYELDYDSSYTDDASVAEKYRVNIKLIPGEYTNIKITTSLDIILAEQIYKYLSKR